jgi:sortase A
MTALQSAQKAEDQQPGPADAGTSTAGPEAASGTGPGTAKAAGGPPARAGSSTDTVLQAVGIGMTLLAVFVLGFAGYLYFLSGVQQARTQTTLYATLRGQLSAAVAPLGSPSPGTPMAILNIPAIGLRNEVVVEGTSPENLTLGPGHLRNSALPGQAGVAVLYGRRATFGAPFGRLPHVGPGDTITVTTGQGTAIYRVKLVGDSAHRIMINQAPNQLLLLTADSRFMPSHFIEVDADLISKPQLNPGGRPAISQSETALGNDPSALVFCFVWGLALVIVSAAGTVAAIRWAAWPAYIVTVPVVIAILYNLYENMAMLLPNIY